MDVIYMTAEQWSRIQINPRQRDVVIHANAIENYLHVVMPQHSVVSAGQFPDGTLIKLDGHTRSLLWDESRIPVPQKISVILHRVMDIEDAMRQYKMYDNQISTEVASHKIQGAMRQHSMYPKSRVLKNGNIAGVLRMVEWSRTGVSPTARTLDHYLAVGEWKDEIMHFDTFVYGHDGSKAHSGVIAAMFLTTRRRGYDNVVSFWSNYLSPEAEGSIREPYNVLKVHMALRKGRGQMGGSENTKQIAEKSLSACENALAGNLIQHLKGISIGKYLSTPDKDMSAKKEGSRERATHKGTFTSAQPSA